MSSDVNPDLDASEISESKEIHVETYDVALEIEIEQSQVTHQCLSCQRSFTTTRGLRTHVGSCKAAKKSKPKIMAKIESSDIAEAEKPRKGIEKETFACNDCPKKFKKKKSFIKHVKHIHSVAPRKVKCAECPARCPNKKVLAAHVEQKHKKYDIKCTGCGQTFSRRYHLDRHLAQKGCDGKERTFYTCQVCGKYYGRKDNLRTHLRWHIQQSAHSYNCKMCKQYCASFNALVRHHVSAHQFNRHECDICGKSVGSRLAFTKHLLVHGEKNHSCNKCDFRCKSVEILRRHALRHEARKPYACHLCPRSFIQPHEFKAHLYKHTGQSNIICHYCSACFPSKSSLASHIARMHEGKPDLFCPIENCKGHTRPFLSEISLKMHMKLHSAEKPFKCGYCSKSFAMKGALLSHERTHAWEKPRRCMYCAAGRAYIRSDLLLRHVRVKHAEEYMNMLKRVRKVLGVECDGSQKLTRQENSAMVNLMDAIIDNMSEEFEDAMNSRTNPENRMIQTSEVMEEPSIVMNEEELAENIKMMIERLIDAETLECFGWPDTSVDTILEGVLQQCKVKVADAERFPRVTCLRENVKQLFLRVIEDDTITRMMNKSTVDEVIRHVVTATTD